MNAIIEPAPRNPRFPTNQHPTEEKGKHLKACEFLKVTYTPLADLDPRKDENVNVYGVVVDASVAFHQKDTNRYICQLKIIDESHHTLGNHEKQCKFITVVFHGKRVEDCPHIKQVGDVIRIHRAQVKEYAQKRQLTVNVYLGATWVLFKQNGGKECANSTDEEDNEKVGGSRYRPYLFSGK